MNFQDKALSGFVLFVFEVLLPAYTKDKIHQNIKKERKVPMNQKVLLMGGSYFIGKKIADVLSKEYSVTVLNRGTKPKSENVETIICDRNDSQAMKIALSEKHFDFVIDVSGTNAEQSKILCENLNLESVKSFVFISSSAVYDVEHLNIPFSENDFLAENKYWTDYGTNKIEAENYLIKNFDKADTNLFILRPPYVYGENNYAQRESFIFEHLLKDKPIIVPNNGETKLQFIYSGDLANIIKTLIQSNLSGINIFNVGNKKPITINAWIMACANAIGKKAKIICFDYEASSYSARDFFPFFDYNNVLDVNKINKIYSQETPFIDGLKIAFEQFLKDRDNIIFKPNVIKNEENILKSQNIN